MCGEILPDTVFSESAKRVLQIGFSLIQETLGPENLGAVYLDVNFLKAIFRPADMRMKEEMWMGTSTLA